MRLAPPAEDAAGSPYWLVDGQLLVEAQVGPDERGLFLLDSGASRTMVARDLASRVGAAREGQPVRIQAFGGARRGVNELTGVVVRFEGAEVGPDGLRAVDLSIRSRLAGVEVSGFLGLDLLRGRRVAIDTTRQRVRLETPAGG